jgi:Zn-finger nucleic acid-binding protein
VVIDRCPACRGLFVEIGELERLQRHGAPIHILVRVIAAILRR